jgi:hypothetical protein
VVWEDNGIGVAADEKERIFKRGFGKNTGLGMFLTREMLAHTRYHDHEKRGAGQGWPFRDFRAGGSIPDNRGKALCTIHCGSSGRSIPS